MVFFEILHLYKLCLLVYEVGKEYQTVSIESLEPVNVFALQEWPKKRFISNYSTCLDQGFLDDDGLDGLESRHALAPSCVEDGGPGSSPASSSATRLGQVRVRRQQLLHLRPQGEDQGIFPCVRQSAKVRQMSHG